MPATAAGAKLSMLTHPGANRPPSPAAAATNIAARWVPPSERDAAYATAGIAAATATIASCADSKVPTIPPASRIPTAARSVASGIQNRWLATGTSLPPGDSMKFHTKSAVRPWPSATRSATSV